MTEPAPTGSWLFGIVETYASFGDHHTGTDADRRTTAWLGALLERLGATVATDTYAFDRYRCQWELRSGVDVVPALPLFYSAVGTWSTDEVEVITVPGVVAGSARGLDPHLGDTAGSIGTSGPTALAIAVDGPAGLVVQCNRVPAVTFGRPAVVIPSTMADRVREQAHLEFSATTEAAHSANLVAAMGPPGASPVTITTPLTGWTPAAGERGTGLAVALAMALDLSADHRVEFVACSGHELDHIGLRHHLDTHVVTGRPVIHLGASVAAIESDPDDGSTTLGRGRLVLTTAGGQRRADIGRLVAAGNWSMPEIEPWPGEGGTWRDAGARVLSFLGRFPLFHTSGDLPEAATTPDALACASSAAVAAARTFLADAES